MRDQKTLKKILQKLKSLYPESQTALHYSSPLELLVATILSAQCTDERVNKVTEPLFKKYRTAKDYARADLKALENEIRSTGFFRNKALSIKRAALVLEEKFGGKIPKKIDDLVTLPGVGRKTANVVLGSVYRIASGVVVDTHVKRVAYRLGLTKNTNPEKVEQDLMKIIPQTKWIDFSHQLIWHGRKVCKAIRPRCEICGLQKWCEKVGL